MMPAHDQQAQTAAYVLGALDPEEHRAFEAHLATCAACTEDVRSLTRVTDALAASAPARTPRAELRARVLQGIAERTAAPPIPLRPRTMADRAVRWVPLAAAFALAVGLGGYASRLQDRVRTLGARVDAAERRAAAAERATLEARSSAQQAQVKLAVVTAPDLMRIDLAGQPPARQATARALWSRARGMVFTAADLPRPPPGRVYQVWVVTSTAAVSAGLLTTDASGGSTTYFETPPDIPPPVAVAVTLEPAGGVPAPTGDKYLVGTPL